MRRLTPDPAEIDPLELIPRLREEIGTGELPHLVANFVSSLDGRASVDGGSTGLGDAGDKEIFRALRGCADGVLAGTGTIDAEHYGALARDPAIAALRARLDLPPQPPLVTVTRSGHVPEIPLLADPGSTLIVYTGADLDLDGAAATVHVERRPPDGLGLDDVLRDLRARHGIGLLLCEGGPSLFAELVSAGLCDELFLTVSGTLAGGEGRSISQGLEPASLRPADPVWVLAQERSLYLRYRLSR